MQTLSDQVLGNESAVLRVILEMLPEGVFWADHEGKLLFHNQAALEISGAGDSAFGNPPVIS